jgi:hypothetical protein
MTYKEFEKMIYDLETEVQHKQLVGWIPPHCPECKGILSHYAFSKHRLICLKCNNVYEMQPRGKDE